LSEAMIAAARKGLADSKSTREGAPDTSPAAKTETALGQLSVVLNQDPPALWEVFRSTQSLDASTLTLTDPATNRVVQPAASFLKSDKEIRTSARFEFNGLEAGEHVLTVRLPSGQIHSQNVEITDQTPPSIELDVSRERVRLPVLLKIPELPDDLKQANCRLSVQLTELPLMKDDLEWRLEESFTYRMGFNTDGTAAYLMRPQQGTLHYGQSPQADNPAVLALGPVRCRFRLHVTNTDVGYGMIEQPLEEAEIRVVEATTKNNGAELEQIAWDLELPEKFLTAARKQLAAAPMKTE